MINQPQQNLPKICHFTITIKSQLLMPKTNKKSKIEDQKNLLINFIFLKVIISNIGAYNILLAQIILHYKLTLTSISCQ